MSTPCPCGSHQPLSACCSPLHQGALPASAEQLMRSRYSAYVLGLIDYLVSTTLPAQQGELDREAIAQWSRSSHWLGLEVEAHRPQSGHPPRAQVVFTARWQDDGGIHSHRECSDFVQCAGRWFFIDPSVALRSGRNDPCPCGSGLKFKKCCQTVRHTHCTASDSC